MRGETSRSRGKMTNTPRLRWPAWVLILDLIGSALVALGLYGQVGSDSLLFAEFVDLRALAVPIIIVGALLVVPLLYSTVSQVRSLR